MVVKMIFWDEMWNMSTEEFEALGKPEKKECCGDWDETGKCKCIKEDEE